MSESVAPIPPPPAVAPSRRRRRRWWLVLVAVAGVLATTVVLAAFVPVDLYAVAPGDARPVEPRVDIQGAETFPTDEEVLFVTVGVPRLSLLGAAVAWIDPDTDVKTPEELFPDQSREESRQQNLKLMGYSKELATYVALTRLGYDVGVIGGGPVIGSLCMEFADDTRETCARFSPADEVLDPGDGIVELDGDPIVLVDDLAPVLARHEPGDVVPVTVLRDGERVETDVELTQSDDGERTIVGFLPSGGFADEVAFELPFQVNIDSGEVGGPSAGLAFTLTLIDLLTPGSLTGGKTVAVTGEILVDGTVGAIGGLRQKTSAVKDAGADVFLVPADQVAIAEDEARGSDLQVIGVRTLDDALDALEGLGGDLSGLPPADVT